MRSTGDLANEQWKRIKPLRPKQKTKHGTPLRNHRKFLNGILWVLRTKSPWRDLPERYGKWTVVYSQFQRWRNSSVWEKMFVALQNTLKIDLRGDWRIRFINSTARDVYHQDAKVEWSPRKNSEVSRMQMVAALKALLHTIADETNNTKIPSTLSERKFNVS